jgi:hypothetical protein
MYIDVVSIAIFLILEIKIFTSRFTEKKKRCGHQSSQRNGRQQ